MAQSCMPVGPHDDEIRPTIIRYAHNSIRWWPGRDFHLPRTLEALQHEVMQGCQGFLIVSLAYDGGAWRVCCTKAALQGGIETDLRPRRPTDAIHLRPGMWWQHVQEGPTWA